ncbi:MAG: LytTR family transcriptional regulator [Chitinophagaceae bacterium]|nr:LytTR family transcriptional regulator [Chitinophagaceae bacterium]
MDSFEAKDNAGSGCSTAYRLLQQGGRLFLNDNSNNNMWLKIIHQPFPINTWRPYWLRGVGCGLFVFLFLFLFKPFNLHYYPFDQLLYASFIYGFITGAVTFLASVILVKVIAPRVQDENWTLGKQILWNTVLMVCIAWVNIYVTQLMHNVSLPLWWQLNMLKWVFMLGVFPVAIVELITYNHYLRRNLKSAAQLSQMVERVHFVKPEVYATESIDQTFFTNIFRDHHPVSETAAVDTLMKKAYSIPHSLLLMGENQGDKVELSGESLLAVQALDNYVNVFWEKNGRLQTNMLRSTLTNIAEQVTGLSHMVRTHRGWLVNIKRVNQVNGNAQGLKLSVDLLWQQVPVSRANIPAYRQLTAMHSATNKELAG